MKSLINLKMVVDERMATEPAHDDMIEALERLKHRIEVSSDYDVSIAWSIVYTRWDIGDVEWTGSMFNGHPMYIPSASWAQRLNDMYDEENTSVMLVFHPSGWKDPDHIIGGINYFQTQVLNPRTNWSIGAWELTIEHELLHSFDNRGPHIKWHEVVGTNNAGNPVNNWDFDVVHESYQGQWVGIFNYIWDRAADEIAIIYPRQIDMAKQLIKFTDENHVYAEVEPFKLVHIETPDALEAAKNRGFVGDNVIELAPQSRSQYKKVGVWVEFPPADL